MKKKDKIQLKMEKDKQKAEKCCARTHTWESEQKVKKEINKIAVI